MFPLKLQIIFGVLCFVFIQTNAQCTVNAPNNGAVDNASPADGDTISYSCNVGYTLDGTQTFSCNGTKLSAAEPTCKPNCVATAPANGQVTPATVLHGTTTLYYCNTGYTIYGTATQTCTSGVLSSVLPTCNGDSCTTSAPTNGAVTSTFVAHGVTTTYYCTSGYTLDGSAIQTCTAGSLSAAVPACKQNAQCTVNAPNNGAVGNASPVDGDTISYSCNVGYTLYGTQTLSCSGTTLSAAEPTCKPNSCTTSAPTNGAVTATFVAHGVTTTYSCTSGYTLDGSAIQTCTAGSLSAAVPTCKQGCSTMAPSNGEVTALTATHGVSVTYSCDSGYAVKGKATQTCNDGSFSSTAATCSAGSTHNSCTATAPANGYVIPIHVGNGDTTTFYCDDGYTMSGTATQTCSLTKLSSVTPACNGDPCAAVAPDNGAVTETAPAYESTTTYSCTAGYSLSGTATQTCTAGTLSDSPPTCNEDCTASAPDNGAVTATTVVHDQSTAYSCTTVGFTLIGIDVRTCISGTLSGSTPSCEQDCTASAPNNGAVTATTVVHDQSTTYSCTTVGFTLIGIAVRTCISGTLSGSTPSCEQDCAASAPTNGEVTATTVVHDQSTTYSCTTGGHTLIGTAVRTCISGTLSGSEPTCEQGKSTVVKEAYYNKQTSGEPTSAGKLIECGVKYADKQFGVFKVNEDGTECTTEPWSWFDTQETVTGTTYYKKDRMTLNLGIPLHLVHPLNANPVPVDSYLVPFPSPMATNNILEVFFTPKIPFMAIFFDLHGDDPDDIINRIQASSTNDFVKMTSRLANGQTNPNQTIISDNVPFVEERMYKVTYKAAESKLQLFVDDQLFLTSDDSREPTDIKYLTLRVVEAEVWLHKIDFFMN